MVEKGRVGWILKVKGINFMVKVRERVEFDGWKGRVGWILRDKGRKGWILRKKGVEIEEKGVEVMEKKLEFHYENGWSWGRKGGI